MRGALSRLTISCHVLGVSKALFLGNDLFDHCRWAPPVRVLTQCLDFVRSSGRPHLQFGQPTRLRGSTEAEIRWSPLVSLRHHRQRPSSSPVRHQSVRWSLHSQAQEVSLRDLTSAASSPTSGAKTRDESVTTPPMGFVSSWRSRLGQLICVGFHTVAVPLRVPPPLSENYPGRSALFHAESAYRILPSGVFPLRKPHTSRCRCSLAVAASSWLPGCPYYPRRSHSPGFVRLNQIQ